MGRMNLWKIILKKSAITLTMRAVCRLLVLVWSGLLVANAEFHCLTVVHCVHVVHFDALFLHFSHCTANFRGLHHATVADLIVAKFLIDLARWPCHYRDIPSNGIVGVIYAWNSASNDVSERRAAYDSHFPMYFPIDRASISDEYPKIGKRKHFHRFFPI